MENNNIPKESILLQQLVNSFYSSAWQHMGKVSDPITQKIEVDLPSASFSIDMLDMLKSKMKGNLTEDEERFLENAVGILKLNYIEEIKKSERMKQNESETDEKADNNQQPTTNN